MNRRKFLRNSSVAGLTISSIAAGCGLHEEAAKQLHKAPAADVSKDDFVLNEVTIDALQQKMQSGEYTSKSITELYLKRIDAIDKKGPAINAVIEINPDAVTIAEAM